MIHSKVITNSNQATLGLNHNINSIPQLTTRLQSDNLDHSTAINNDRPFPGRPAFEGSRRAEKFDHNFNEVISRALKGEFPPPSYRETTDREGPSLAVIRNNTNNSNAVPNTTQPTTGSREGSSSTVNKDNSASPMTRGAVPAQALQAGAEAAGAISQGFQNSFIIGNNSRISNNYFNTSGGVKGNFHGQDHIAMMESNALARASERANNFSTTGKAFAGPMGQLFGSMIGRAKLAKFDKEEMGKIDPKIANTNDGKRIDPRNAVTSTYKDDSTSSTYDKSKDVLKPAQKQQSQGGSSDQSLGQLVENFVPNSGGLSALHPNNVSETIQKEEIVPSESNSNNNQPKPTTNLLQKLVNGISNRSFSNLEQAGKPSQETPSQMESQENDSPGISIVNSGTRETSV